MSKMYTKRKNKSTSFSLNDDYDLKLLKHAEQKENGNFSRYIKRLIMRDMEGGNFNNNVIQIPLIKETDATQEDIKAMSNFL